MTVPEPITNLYDEPKFDKPAEEPRQPRRSVSSDVDIVITLTSPGGEQVESSENQGSKEYVHKISTGHFSCCKLSVHLCPHSVTDWKVHSVADQKVHGIDLLFEVFSPTAFLCAIICGVLCVVSLKITIIFISSAACLS